MLAGYSVCGFGLRTTPPLMKARRSSIAFLYFLWCRLDSGRRLASAARLLLLVSLLAYLSRRLATQGYGTFTVLRPSCLKLGPLVLTYSLYVLTLASPSAPIPLADLG